MSKLLSSITGGGGLPKLAPDLSKIGTYTNESVVYTTITGIDGSAGMVTALSLTGKYTLTWLRFEDLTAENNTFKLTVDGVVIFDETVPTLTQQTLIGQTSTSENLIDGPFLVSSSLLLEVQTTTDTNISLQYGVRPIL